MTKHIGSSVKDIISKSLKSDRPYNIFTNIVLNRIDQNIWHLSLYPILYRMNGRMEW